MNAEVDRRAGTIIATMDRVIMWALTGLMGWLCFSHVQLREQVATMMERSDSTRAQLADMRTELGRLTAADSAAVQRIQNLELGAARHGWGSK